MYVGQSVCFSETERERDDGTKFLRHTHNNDINCEFTLVSKFPSSSIIKRREISLDQTGFLDWIVFKRKG